ncbi:hypothetical protein F5887DRAFT_962407 [Amanita rubescens]|nr:hypothetical protein F5887DRAFT_962407 [Amanita rubescens]
MDRTVPWHQLRTFEVVTAGESPVTPSSCLNVLRQSRLLEHCRISLSEESSFASTVISTGEKIVLASMDYFKAEFSDGLVVPMFLQPLVMPNVTTFSLGQLSYTTLGCDMPTLIGIVQRSGGMRRIRCLEIDSSSAVLDIGVLLELLPSLESISIGNGHLNDNAIKRLSSGKLGPRLCDIYLEVPHDGGQILSMAESRYQNATHSPDSKQIEGMPCPFKSISIPCMATQSESAYRSRIKLLSEKCGTSINLEDEYGE